MTAPRKTSLSSRMTSKGQVTIPKFMRDRFGIAPGAAVEFADEGGRLVVAARTDGPQRSRFDLEAPPPGWTGMTTEQLMRLTRGDEW